MRLYMSSNFTDFYTSKNLRYAAFSNLASLGPPVLSLNDDLFVEVNLERPLISEAFAPYTEFSTVMENCWGTPSQSRDGALKVKITLILIAPKNLSCGGCEINSSLPQQIR